MTTITQLAQIGVCALAATISAGELSLGDDAVKMEGAAPGTDRAAHAAAIDNAQTAILVDALESYWGTSDLSLFKPILDKASSYIRYYQVLHQREEDGAVLVEISAAVLKEQLRRDAALLMLTRLKRKPRIVVAIAEQPNPSGPYIVAAESSAEKTITQVFHEKGFEVIAAERLLRLYTQEALLARLQEDASGLARLARENLGQVAVVGQSDCESEPAAPESNVMKNKVTLTLRVVRAHDEQVIDTLTAEAVVNSLSISEGVVQANIDAATKLREAALVAVVLAAARPAGHDETILEIEQIGKPERLGEIREVIQQFPGVEEAEELVNSPDLARLRVKYDGTMAPFVEYVTAHAFDQYRLDARSVVERVVTLVVRPQEAKP